MESSSPLGIGHVLVTRALSALLLVVAPTTAFAQGLIWSLPEDGSWVRFSGTYQQVVFDATGDKTPTIEDATSTYECDAAKIDFAEVVCWGRTVEIKSVGKETGKFRGNDVDCRWIEIKTTTGVKTETGIDPGPTGIRIWKVLVPESEIRGEAVDAADIPVSFLPVVKGFQKVGNAQPQPISAPVLQVYPMLTLVAQYRRVQPEPTAGDPEINLDGGTISPVKGEIIVESRTDRSTNTGILWRSDALPFGLAKWEVTLIREKKDATAGRDRFAPTTRVHVEMKVTASGDKAESEILVGE